MCLSPDDTVARTERGRTEDTPWSILHMCSTQRSSHGATPKNKSQGKNWRTKGGTETFMQNSRIRSSNLLPRNSIYLETRLSQLSEQKVHRKVAISAATAGPDMLCVDVSRLASALVGSTQNGYSMYSIYICINKYASNFPEAYYKTATKHITTRFGRSSSAQSVFKRKPV